MRASASSSKERKMVSTVRPLDATMSSSASAWSINQSRYSSTSPAVPTAERSEERRVGKECRSRWWADHQKKKNMKYGHGLYNYHVNLHSLIDIANSHYDE